MCRRLKRGLTNGRKEVEQLRGRRSGVLIYESPRRLKGGFYSDLVLLRIHGFCSQRLPITAFTVRWQLVPETSVQPSPTNHSPKSWDGEHQPRKGYTKNLNIPKRAIKGLGLGHRSLCTDNKSPQLQQLAQTRPQSQTLHTKNIISSDQSASPSWLLGFTTFPD